MTPLELERWVILASDASRPQLQWEANAILHRWSTQEQTTEWVNVLLQVLSVTKQEPVLFYSLTTLQRLDLTMAQRASLRQYILTTFSASCATTQHATSIYLRTKVGVVLAHLIRCDFPHTWPTAFDDLMQPALLHTSPDIFLRALDALMEDFGMNENEINSHLKDVLRETKNASASSTTITSNSNHAASSSYSLSSLAARCMQMVLSILGQSYNVILSASSSSTSSPGTIMMNGHEQPRLGAALQLAALALTVLKHFISWVDLTVILNEELQVLNLVFAVLKATTSTSTSNGVAEDSGAVAVLTVACLHELVGRGMEAYKKIALLRDTDLLQRIYLHINLDTVDSSPIDVVLEVAKLINLTGLELLPVWEEASSSTTTPTTTTASSNERDAMTSVLATLLQQLLDLFFRCFAYDDIDVSGAVIPLASRLAASVAKEEPNSTNTSIPSLRQHLPQLFTTLYRQMKYPVDFQYDYEDEEEAEEEVYRSELRKLNQRLVRVAPEMALQFLCTTLANLPVPISQSPTPDLEAALRLVYHYCEGIQPSPGLKVVMRLEIFRNVLVALHNSDITSHPHREVLTLYYETAVRYHPIFKDYPDILFKVLEALSGSHGLQHSHPRVRSRSCYLLLRLVKAVTGLMRPYVETAINGIQGLLSNSAKYDLRTEDTMYLFETIGLLLGKTQLGDADRRRYLNQVIKPHIQAIEQVISSLTTSDDSERDGSILAGSIAAIANLSKGNSTKATDADDVLQEAVRVTLAALEVMPLNDQVRGKSMILLQRMIQCIGIKLLLSMPRFLSLLVENCNSEDITDVAQLYNQLCIRFKREAVPVLDEALLPFLSKCRSLMPSTSEVVATVSNGSNQQYIPPHLRTEQLSIQKLAFIVLHHIVLHRATAVLISPTNANHLAQLLQTMSEGAVHVDDAGVKKTCLSFFRELAVQWFEEESNHAITGNASMHAVLLLQFVCDVLIPSMFQCILVNPAFQADDALQSRNVFEFGQILSVLRRDPYCQEAYASSVSKTLRSLGCPYQLSEVVVQASTGDEICSQLKELIKVAKAKNLVRA